QLELTHYLTRLKVAPDVSDPAYEGERARAQGLAQKLGLPALARAWQMLLKGLAEVQTAPSPQKAAEMVLVRLSYVADLPPPGDIVKSLGQERESPASPPAPQPLRASPAIAGNGQALAMPAPLPPPASASPAPRSFLEVVELFDRHREGILRAHLYHQVRLVRFEPGRIELRPLEGAPRDLANRLGQLLGQWTEHRWVVSVSSEEGEPTLKEQAEAKDRVERQAAAAHPMVRAVLEIFPGARIEAVRELGPEEGMPLAPSDEGEEGDFVS
ncbi:MAG TPA: DNA polymerase III subunit gamma/tau, partial [Stellaceae bacterium]|nr:DNA polymerase III subunit gamma/tau [Stellaceae bacterium]